MLKALETTPQYHLFRMHFKNHAVMLLQVFYNFLTLLVSPKKFNQN